jgi:citrate lyase subunit beta/citryl-CoA lyase
MDLRPEPSGELHLMPYLMQRLITVANAAGVVPLGAWWRAPARGLLASPDDTHAAAVRGRHIGFKGALCLRANQVEPLNRGLTPSRDEIEAARALIANYHSGTGDGLAVIRRQDRIIDLPTVRQASHLIAYAEACAEHDAARARTQPRAAL